MKLLLATLALTMAGISAAMALDADTQGIIDQHKRGKLVGIEDVAHLMRESARWCYLEEAGSCSWTDIYLDVSDTGAIFEIANAWDADRDIAFTDEGTFRDNKICQSGYDWVPSVRATQRSDGSAVGGRPLHELKSDIYGSQSAALSTRDDCFDYLFVSADADQDVVTLLQRQYVDDIYDPANDVEVTLHFNAEEAAGLTLRW